MALTTTTHSGSASSIANRTARESGLKEIARYFVVPGRFFFALIFILSGVQHFSREMIAYASAQGLPLAGLLVPATGLLAVLGGLSVLFGYRTRIGALMLMAFLVPVTLFMHNFWAIMDPQAAQLQLTHFMKNIALLGSTFLIFYFGSGPLSLDEKSGRDLATT